MAKAKGGAPLKAPDGLTVAVFFRADEALVARVDAAKDRRSEDTGVKWSRADMMRALLKYALDRDDESQPVGYMSAAPKRARKGAK